MIFAEDRGPNYFCTLFFRVNLRLRFCGSLMDQHPLHRHSKLRRLFGINERDGRIPMDILSQFLAVAHIPRFWHCYTYFRHHHDRGFQFAEAE